MFAAARERISDALITMGTDRALERQQMQRSLLASVDPYASGYRGALAALLTAEMFDGAMRWLGWRLQPRNIAPH